MRTLVLTAAFLMMLVPTALAGEDDETPTRPPDASADASSPSQAAGDDAAWVEDCPPDTMCAAGAEEPTRGPEDGSCEACRADDTPIPYGPGDCIECSGPAPGDTCMDGAGEGEACDEDVQYIGAPQADPTPIGAQQDQAAEVEAEDSKTVPGLAIAGILFVAAIAVVLRQAAWS